MGAQEDVTEFLQAIIRGIDRCAGADTIREDFYNRFGNRMQDRLDCMHCGHVRDWRSEDSGSVCVRATKWYPGGVLTDALARKFATENVGE